MLKNKGFTLIEVIIVMVILGILGTVVVDVISGANGPSGEQMFRQHISVTMPNADISTLSFSCTADTEYFNVSHCSGTVIAPATFTSTGEVDTYATFQVGARCSSSSNGCS